MAATQYQVFCRYLNEKVNHALSNQTDAEWIGFEEWQELLKNATQAETDIPELVNKINQESAKPASQRNEDQIYIWQKQLTKARGYVTQRDYILKRKAEGKYCIENLHIRPLDKSLPREHDTELYQTVIDESYASNPKWDMVFLYDGITFAKAESAGSQKQIPEVYYERMKRVKLDPWFLYSTHGSLLAAMEKARTLVNILGKNGVKIGKVVPLEQYIEIV